WTPHTARRMQRVMWHCRPAPSVTGRPLHIGFREGFGEHGARRARCVRIRIIHAASNRDTPHALKRLAMPLGQKLSCGQIAAIVLLQVRLATRSNAAVAVDRRVPPQERAMEIMVWLARVVPRRVGRLPLFDQLIDRPASDCSFSCLVEPTWLEANTVSTIFPAK